MAEQTDPILDYTQRLETVFEGMREPFEACRKATSGRWSLEGRLYLTDKKVNHNHLELNEGQIPTLPSSLKEAILEMHYQCAARETLYKVLVVGDGTFGRQLLVSESSVYEELKLIAETMLVDVSANYNVTLADEPTASSTNRILVKYSGTDESSGTPLRAIMGFTQELLRRYFGSKNVNVTDFDLQPLYDKMLKEADKEVTKTEEALTAYCGAQLGEIAKDRIVRAARHDTMSYSYMRAAYDGIIKCFHTVDGTARVITKDPFFLNQNSFLFTFDRLRESWSMRTLRDWPEWRNHFLPEGGTNAETIGPYADRDLLPLMKGLEIAVNNDDNQGVYRRMARLYIALKYSLPVLNGNNELQQYCNRQANVFIQKLTNF